MYKHSISNNDGMRKLGDSLQEKTSIKPDKIIKEAISAH